MVNNHMKRYSTSLAVRKIKIKTAMTYHYPNIRRAKIKLWTIPSADCDAK